MVSKGRATLAVLAVCVSSFVAAGAHAATCGAAASSRGEWPSYGGDKSNSRNQTLETTINASNASALAPKWSFNVAGAGGTGSFQSTPAVSDGCVFVSTDAGDIFALNASDGSLIWHQKYPVGGQVAGVFGLAVSNGMVYGNTVDDSGPFAFALDEGTGGQVWRSGSLKSLGSTVNASAVVWNGLDIVSVWGDDPDPSQHNGFAIVDASNGQVITKTFVVPPSEWAQGYAGGGIWGTMAIDPASGFGYVGTANPYSKTKEHPNTNAIIKVDLNRGSPTFGAVVSSYHGKPDNYVGGAAYDNPACAVLGPQQTSYATAGCFQLDVDFGASPNLWRASDGTLMVGDQQKAGVYHGVNAQSMGGVWQQVDSAPLLLGNAGTGTVTADAVVAAANPGVLWAMDKSTGAVKWNSATADGARYEALSSANGVIYSTDNLGNFDGFDASSGALLVKRAIRSDAGGGSGDPTSAVGLGGLLSSSGPAIAEGKVFAPNSGSLVAYAL